MAEVTDEGVIIDTLDGVLDSINADFLTEFGTGVNGIDTSPQSYTGRQNPIIASRIVAVQQLIAEVATAINPNNAQGRLLDFIGSLFVEPRNPASAATIPARLYGVPGFLVGDRRVRYRRNGTIWRVPLGTLIEAAGIVDVDLVSDVTGTTLSDGTPIEAFQDGSDQWTIVDSSPANFFAVESTGAYSEGTTIEADSPYRVRIGLAGRSSGTGTEDGIRRAIARVAGTDAVVDNNRDIFVNANGVPGKSTEVIYDQGTDEDVAQAIYDSFSDTNMWYGLYAVTAYRRDADGNLDLNQPVTILQTRANRTLISWEVTIDSALSETTLPDDVVSIVQTALVTYTNTTLRIGLDVQPGEGAAAIRVALPVGSIVDGNLTVLAGIVGGPPPAGVPIALTSRERARTDAAPQAAEVIASNSQTYNIFAGDVLILAVDGGTAQQVTMLVTDFQVISAATALEVATVINTRMSGFVAGVEGGALVIRSGTTGASSSVGVLAGTSLTLLASLGLAIATVTGNDGYVTVVVL